MNSKTHLLFIVSLLCSEQGYTQITQRIKKKYSCKPPPLRPHPLPPPLLHAVAPYDEHLEQISQFMLGLPISSSNAFSLICIFFKRGSTLTKRAIGVCVKSLSNSTLFWHKKFNLLSNCHKHHCVTALGNSSALAFLCRASHKVI